MTISVPPRLKTAAMGVLLLLISVGVGAAGLSGILKTAHQFHQRDVLISSDRFMGTMTVIAPALIPISLLFLFAKSSETSTGKRRTKAEKARTDRAFWWGKAYVIYLFASLVVAALAPLAQYALIDHLALARGYAPCPKPNWPRHQNDRWARPGQRCPGEGTPADL